MNGIWDAGKEFILGGILMNILIICVIGMIWSWFVFPPRPKIALRIRLSVFISLFFPFCTLCFMCGSGLLILIEEAAAFMAGAGPKEKDNG